MTVGGNVRMIEGFDSAVLPFASSFQNASNPAPFFRFQNNVGVIVSHFRLGGIFAQQGVPGIRWFEHDSAHPVTVRNIVLNNGTYATSAYKNTVNGTGDLFIEDVAGSYWEIYHPQNVYARQLNMESVTRKFFNKGGTLWILGIKTEQPGRSNDSAAIIDTQLGGQTEVLGGLVFIRPVAPLPAKPAFLMNNSQVSLVYAVSAIDPNASATTPTTTSMDFNVQVQEVEAGVSRSLFSADVQDQIAAQPFLLSRGLGLMMPLYTSKR